MLCNDVISCQTFKKQRLTLCEAEGADQQKKRSESEIHSDDNLVWIKRRRRACR